MRPTPAPPRQHVGIRDGKIDALQIDQVSDVTDGSVADDRQNTQVVGVVEGLAEIGSVAHERALEQSAFVLQRALKRLKV